MSNVLWSIAINFQVFSSRARLFIIKFNADNFILIIYLSHTTTIILGEIVYMDMTSRKRLLILTIMEAHMNEWIEREWEMGTIRIFLLPRIYGSDQLINHTLNYRVLSLPFIQVFHYNSARVLFISKALNHITNKNYCENSYIVIKSENSHRDHAHRTSKIISRTHLSHDSFFSHASNVSS